MWRTADFNKVGAALKLLNGETPSGRQFDHKGKLIVEDLHNFFTTLNNFLYSPLTKEQRYQEKLRQMRQHEAENKTANVPIVSKDFEWKTLPPGALLYTIFVNGDGTYTHRGDGIHTETFPGVAGTISVRTRFSSGDGYDLRNPLHSATLGAAIRDLAAVYLWGAYSPMLDRFTGAVVGSSACLGMYIQACETREEFFARQGVRVRPPLAKAAQDVLENNQALRELELLNDPRGTTSNIHGQITNLALTTKGKQFFGIDTTREKKRLPKRGYHSSRD